MNIDDLEKHYAHVGEREMETLIGSKGFTELVTRLHRQDRLDRRFLLTKRMVPMSVGIALLAWVLLVSPRNGVLAIGGWSLCMLSLCVALAFHISDYIGVANESFDMSVREFLQTKEKRLGSWRASPLKYHLCFAGFVIGYGMMMTGVWFLARRTTGMATFLREPLFFIVLSILIAAMGVSWIVGEVRFRRRYLLQHQSLVDTISEMKREIDSSE